MKKLLALLVSFTTVQVTHAQPLSKAANEAYLITRMASKYHVQPRPVNDDFSGNVFDQVLKELDDQRIFFTKEDIDKLLPYRLQLDDIIKQQRQDFLQSLISLYQQRLLQADTIISNICKTPFSFSAAEKFTVAEDTTFPANLPEMRLKLYKRLKLSVLNSLVAIQEEQNEAGRPLQQKQLDSLEAVVRKRTEKIFKRSIISLGQRAGGLQQSIADIYCKAIASCYDPHTEYFPLAEKENFESALGNDAYDFGFNTDDDDDENAGGVVISNLKPGSPAYKSGLLNKGDKLMSVQWEGKDSVDISDADNDEVSDILSSNNHDKITFTVKKSDGSTQKVTLKKEKTADDEGNKVKSFLLKGDKTIGYILLPAFYSDWKEEENDVNGCANDVSKEILKLEKENMDGLILDLRYNGGGSIEEAVALSGIFIDAGPVAQVKGAADKILTLKDVNRGSIYTGPLVLLVNGYSASASEMVAGTLQDYHRALIVGTSTYGKATGQVVLPLDTTATFQSGNSSKKTAGSYLKVTTGKLYRITGGTAQGKGVQPDVFVPDFLQASAEREMNEPYALRVANIDSNKYYRSYPPIDIQSLNSTAQKEIESDEYFNKLEAYIKEYKTRREDKDVSLRWADAMQEEKRHTVTIRDLVKSRGSVAAPFSIENNAYEEQRLQTDEALEATNDTLKIYLSHDHQLRIAYKLLLSMAK